MAKGGNVSQKVEVKVLICPECEQNMQLVDLMCKKQNGNLSGRPKKYWLCKCGHLQKKIRGDINDVG